MIPCKSLFLLIIILPLCSCTVGPDYVKPAVPIPAHFKESIKTKDWVKAKPSDTCNRGAWWRIFHDSELNRLEAELNQSNQNIAAAYANYMQARELVNEARASYLPTITSLASFTRQKQGAASSSFINSSATGGASTGSATTNFGRAGSQITNSYSLVFDASWSPDIWGLVHRTVETREAQAEASAALLANTQLSSQGSLAQYYFELRALDMDQKILDDTVTANQKILKITKQQYQSGVVSNSAILQAQGQVETAKAQAINNHINRAIYEHAIAVLIGKPPEEFSLKPKPLAKNPPTIPPIFPSQLLERRPDIAEAERTMAAANAEIGVAVAAYFPSLTLNSTGSFFGKTISHWIEMPNLVWSVGPQLAETIYDGGLRDATIAAAKASYISAVATYRQTVLAAFQNVEDNLATVRYLKDQSIAANAAARDSKQSLALTINEYKAGTVDYTTVLTAQTAAFTAEKSAADVTGLRMSAAVSLIMSLGGEWSNTYIKCDS